MKKKILTLELLWQMQLFLYIINIESTQSRLSSIHQGCGSEKRDQRGSEGSLTEDSDPQFLPVPPQRNLLRSQVILNDKILQDHCFLLRLIWINWLMNPLFFFLLIRNEYTDWDRPSALDPLSMRDSLSSALSDALVVAPLMHVVHLHATRSANPSSTFLYHFQVVIVMDS